MISFRKKKRPTYLSHNYNVADVLVDGKRVGSIWKWNIGFQYISNEDTAGTTWHNPKSTLEAAMDDLIYLPLMLKKKELVG